MEVVLQYLPGIVLATIFIGGWIWVVGRGRTEEQAIEDLKNNARRGGFKLEDKDLKVRK